MKAYVLPSLVRVAPWGDSPSDLEVLGRPLAELRRATLEAAGFEVVELDSDDSLPEHGEHLVLLAHVHVSRDCLRELRRLASGSAENRVLALPACAFVGFTAPLAKLRSVVHEGRVVHLYDVFWILKGRFERDRLDAYTPAVVEPEERVVPTSAPPFVTSERLPMGVTRRFVFHIRHWTHLLLANLLGAMGEAWSRGREPRTWAWIAWRLLGAFPWTPRRLLNCVVHKGRRGFIHPTASVEGCVLGDGVVIDAGAVVRGSILADGAHVMQHARVQWSVIGPGARVAWNGIVSFSVLMRGSEVSFPGVQMGVVGRNAWLASGVWPYDTNFAGPIRVRDGERIVPTHHHLLGMAIGHHAVLGMGVKIGAGREIPNGTRWVEDPSGIASKIPPTLIEGHTYVVRDGVPVDLDED